MKKNLALAVSLLTAFGLLVIVGCGGGGTGVEGRYVYDTVGAEAVIELMGNGTFTLHITGEDEYEGLEMDVTGTYDVEGDTVTMEVSEKAEGEYEGPIGQPFGGEATTTLTVKDGHLVDEYDSKWQKQ